MIRKFLTQSKKIVLIAATSAFALFAASNAYTSENQYMLNGASQQTLNQLVLEVGGEVVHEFDVVSGVSAKLTETQLETLMQNYPMIRVESSATKEIAGYVWDRPRKVTRLAGYVWDRPRKVTRIAGYVWDRPRKVTRIAGYVWDRPRKVTRIAGYVWDRPRKGVARLV